MSRLVKVVVTILIISLAISTLPLNAGELKGVKMEDTIDVEGQKLVLNGMALRKKMIFKVYVAGLYIPQKETSGEKILQTDGPRRTVMHFVRTVSAKKINGGWKDGLEDNTPNASPELKKQFETLYTLMEEIKDGNRLIFTYLPEKGTTVEANGKVKGTIEGKAFADALFACWIGPKPGPGKGFKKNLLGK
jgi:Chalcone isomerase-like